MTFQNKGTQPSRVSLCICIFTYLISEFVTFLYQESDISGSQLEPLGSLSFNNIIIYTTATSSVQPQACVRH